MVDLFCHQAAESKGERI